MPDAGAADPERVLCDEDPVTLESRFKAALEPRAFDDGDGGTGGVPDAEAETRAEENIPRAAGNGLACMPRVTSLF